MHHVKCFLQWVSLTRGNPSRMKTIVLVWWTERDEWAWATTRLNTQTQMYSWIDPVWQQAGNSHSSTLLSLAQEVRLKDKFMGRKVEEPAGNFVTFLSKVSRLLRYRIQQLFCWVFRCAMVFVWGFGGGKLSKSSQGCFQAKCWERNTTLHCFLWGNVTVGGRGKNNDICREHKETTHWKENYENML